VVRIAGGAHILNGTELFHIGRRNYLAARKLLWKAGILVAAELVGARFREPCSWRLRPAGLLFVKGRSTRRWLGSGLREEGAKMSSVVLIVDDSPVMRTFIRRVMKLAGFEDAEYLEAADG
jgi:hypothetical protein